MDTNFRLNSFELFGYDFMVDTNFKVWLIEVNTNPCLDTKPIHLSRIIPQVIENTLKIVCDPLFPLKKPKEWESSFENKFELVFNMAAEPRIQGPVDLVSENEDTDSECEEEAN